MTFDNHERPSRSLPYPLEYPEQFDVYPETTGDVLKVTPDFFPEDPEERIDIVLNMSFNEFTAIASSIDIGRDIGYGEQSAAVWWAWIRALVGVATVSCEDIADCIETSEEVQDAITTNQNIQLSNLMQNANSGITYPSVDAETDTINTIPQAIGAAKDEEIKELPNCNLDALWAGIRDGIVQRLDDNARSVLEWLVSKADVAERGTALIGAIPIFGSMAKAVLDQMVELAPDMLNLFESYSSIEHMDEIACEIFGIVCSECRYPTYDEVFQYYASAGITGFTDIDDLVIATATDLLFGSSELAALAFYHTMIAYELLVLYMGSKFYGLSGSNALLTLASLGEDFANDNWMVLCDACDETYALYVWDFVTQGQGNSYVTQGFASGSVAQFIPGMGWRLAAIDASNGLMTVGFLLETTWEFVAVAYKTTSVPGSQTTQLRVTPATATGGTQLNMSPGTEWTEYANGLASITNRKELAIRVADPLSDDTYLEKIAFICNVGHAPSGAIPTSDNTFS